MSMCGRDSPTNVPVENFWRYFLLEKRIFDMKWNDMSCATNISLIFGAVCSIVHKQFWNVNNVKSWKCAHLQIGCKV
jgi:hypothetical protein